MVKSRRTIHILFFTIIFMLILFGTTLSVYGAYSKQEAAKETTERKYCTSIQLQSGDTLWSLAERYADEEHYRNHFEYIEEIKKMNNLKSDKIQAGNHIMVVYYR